MQDNIEHVILFHILAISRSRYLAPYRHCFVSHCLAPYSRYLTIEITRQGNSKMAILVLP